MSILDEVGGAAAASLDNILSTLKNPFGNKLPDRFPEDFPDGFVCQEYIDGAQGQRFALKGNMLPMVPFTFGGEQKIVKDYYPGNAEPVVQPLGPRETDTVIKGRFKIKNVDNESGKKEGSLYPVAEAIQRNIDAFRVRGNLCHFTMGLWERWGYVEKCEFEMFQVSRIDYKITLAIVGFNQPKNAKFVTNVKDVPFAIAKDLIAAFNALEPVPGTMPKDLSKLLNGYISDLATAINLVTNFVGTTLKTVEDLEGNLNRAVGLIKNARANISIFKRRIRGIYMGVSNLGSTTAEAVSDLVTDSVKAAKINANSLRNGSYLLTSVSSTNQMEQILARMQSQFGALAAKKPRARYSVKVGDTLQKIAIKFYNDANQWKLIYDYNKLTSTILTSGTVLEIPKS